MVTWLNRLTDEHHASERLAARWHRLHALVYGGLVGLYVGAIVWHLAAAARHDRESVE